MGADGDENGRLLSADDLAGDGSAGLRDVADEFDPTICQEMKLDHGVLSFLPLLTDIDWKVPVVPLAVNVIQHPIPTVLSQTWWKFEVV